MNIALCTCGADISRHRDDADPEWDWASGFSVGESSLGHAFKAAGTKYRCSELVTVAGETWMCPRPDYHLDEDVPHGPLTGEKLW